jgi:hypothetical protein
MWFDIIKIDEYERATAEQFADAEDLKLDSQKEKEAEEARKEKEKKDWLEQLKGIWIKLYKELPSDDDYVSGGDTGYPHHFIIENPSKHFYAKKIKRLTLNNPEERTKRLEDFFNIHELLYDYIGKEKWDFDDINDDWPKAQKIFEDDLYELDDGDEVNKFKQLYN